MGKDILVIDKGGRPPFEFTPKVLQQIQDLASYMCTKEEVANIIGCHRATLYRNEKALEAYDKGVNVAKKNIRKTQFDIATKLNSSMMAIYLDRVYLKQNPNIVESEESTPLPITDIIDIEELKNDTIPKKEI